VSSAAEALEQIETHRPEIVLTDISMPGMNGLELAERVGRDFPETRTIILSMHTDREYALHAFCRGAAGYLIKDVSDEELERAIRAVARGESYLSPVISGHVVSDYARLAAQQAEEESPLTPRQREILALIAQGRTTKGIARDLNLSVKTVETHRAQIMDRLNIHDIAGLVRYAIKAGLVPPDF